MDAGFEQTGVAKYALLKSAADIDSLEQVFIITQYATETNTSAATDSTDATGETTAETTAATE